MNLSFVAVSIAVSLLSLVISIMIGTGIAAVVPGNPDPILFTQKTKHSFGFYFGLLLWPVVSFVFCGSAALSHHGSFVLGGLVGFTFAVAVITTLSLSSQVRRVRRHRDHWLVDQILSLIEAWVTGLVIPPITPDVDVAALHEGAKLAGHVTIRFPEKVTPHSETIRLAATRLRQTVPGGIGITINVGSKLLVSIPRTRDPEPPADTIVKRR